MEPGPTLSRSLVRAAVRFQHEQLTAELRDKVKIALLDLLSSAFESLDTAVSRRVLKLAARHQTGPAAVVGTPLSVPASMAAFANAVLAHGLVREDMHTESVSHLGVVVFPALLALAQQQITSGNDFMAAAICGYEAGAAVGCAVMDAATVRVRRPTGVTGPIGAAVGGSLLCGLDESAAVSALGIAANTVAGLNEWPRSGADDMFLHAGFAARNAVTAVELAQLGAYGSETALDGKAGLFTALGHPDAVDRVRMFTGPRPRILEVYNKPAPACNYAQTACQAALALCQERFEPAEIAAVEVKCSAAALNYPGCDVPGPFERVLQAKMSIQFCVAATLVRRSVEENNYRLLEDPEIRRLAAVAVLREDPAFTRAYPGAQGSEVIITLRDGRQFSRRLDDLAPATPPQIRRRFRASAAAVLGRVSADIVEATIDSLEEQEDAGILNALLTAR